MIGEIKERGTADQVFQKGTAREDSPGQLFRIRFFSQILLDPEHWSVDWVISELDVIRNSAILGRDESLHSSGDGCVNEGDLAIDSGSCGR